MRGGAPARWMKPLLPTGEREVGVRGTYAGHFEHWNLTNLRPGFVPRYVHKKKVPARQRLGYVVAGAMTFRFADHEETYEAGDAYYVPPGHTPVHHAGAEIVEFSPTDELMQTIAVVMGNLEAAGVPVAAEAAR